MAASDLGGALRGATRLCLKLTFRNLARQSTEEMRNCLPFQIKRARSKIDDAVMLTQDFRAK